MNAEKSNTCLCLLRIVASPRSTCRLMGPPVPTKKGFLQLGRGCLSLFAHCPRRPPSPALAALLHDLCVHTQGQAGHTAFLTAYGTTITWTHIMCSVVCCQDIWEHNVDKGNYMCARGLRLCTCDISQHTFEAAVFVGSLLCL